MSSISELNEITTESKNLQSEIIANIVRSKNSTTKLLPTKERAGDENLELEKYVQKYAVSLVNEESNFRDQYNSYKDSIKEKLESLYNLPSGTAFSEKAMKFAQEIEEGDEKVLENAINFEKHLQSRHESLTSLAITEKVPQPSAHIYNIRGTKQTPLIKPNTQAAQVAQVVQPAKTTVATTVTSAPSYNILNKRHMDLPIFYGDITEWPAFYMIFDALVAKDTECPNVMKHNILRQHLRGAPYDLVKPYKADGTEFETALERLVKMYNADDIQYDYLWSRLINLPRAKENPENMRHIHNEMNAIINSLKSHGSIETQNFQSVIKTKIPRATLLEILKMKPTNTTGILNAFDDIISIEEMAQRSHNTSYKEERSIFTVKKTNSQRNCKFCSRNNHASYECKTVATLNDRREYVKNKQLCYNCMNSGHTSRECRSPKCRKCDKKHNSALCPKNQNTTHSSQHNAYNERKQQTENQNWKTYKNDNSNNFRKPNEGQQQQQQKYQSNQKQWNQGQGNQQNGQKSSGQSGFNNQKYQNKGHSGPPKFHNPQKAKGFQVSTNHTSLMIANAPVLINDDIETIPILLDSGADQSFILSEYAGEKNMKIIEENIELDLSVFGKNNSTIISNKVEFGILTNSDNDSAIRVEALTVPKITDLFDPIDLSEEERRFLAERNQKTVNITKPTTPVALIGCDIFWNLMADEKIEKLPTEQVDNETNDGFYIPYGLVFNNSSNTTKVRTVFDASSKRRGELSLNNALHQGPSLVPEIQAILLRIRQGKYIISGDIEKAFHAVERHIDFKRDEDVEIAVFTDASEIAYGACLYLKTKIKDKEALAQIKNQSSTKAEKQPIFVENRTREIWNTLLDLKKEDESRNINLAHVFTDQNPADHITRGCNSIEELVMTNWPNGNEWLSDNNHKDHPYQISDDNKIIVPVPLDDIPTTQSTTSQTVAPPPTTTRRTTTQTTTTQTVPTTTMQTIAPTPLTTRRTTATPTTTQTVPTTTTTEYYSPYTPQWRTPHTTAEWQYASTTPWYTPWTYPPYPTTTPYRYPTQDPSRYTSQHDYLNDYHAGLQRRVHANYPRQEGQRRSVTTTEPRITTTEPRTTTPKTTPKMETIQFFEAHESKSRIECTKKGANLVEEDEIANNTNTVCTENWCDHELTVSHNFRKCQKGPIMYTKNVTVHADSSKRCHGMGECVDRKCLDDTLTAQAAAEKYGANAYFRQKHAYFIGHMQYLPLTTSSKYIVVNHGPML
ncbi:hypothetical protein B9Z55_028507 [Caenorhabditis nigoni]|uniref:CCHC-type domain-containing protein n=1 Tax=Caenorhabditis nigoni TaxID=1611254 RepID=A0A2G5SB04_9PELO|nr:hypothetical protein B9Z55_028507 [Caenorhabditis nigoni]